MPAVVRVKRRVDEEPLAALILNSKRRRVEETYTSINESGEERNIASNTDGLSTLLKFAGTIEKQDITATAQLAKLTKEEAKELVIKKSRKPLNCTEKSRREVRQNTKEQRYRVVNCMRTTLSADIDTNDSQSTKEVTIVDIEKQVEVDNEDVTSKSSSCGRNAEQSREANVSEVATIANTNAQHLTTEVEHLFFNNSAYVYDLYLPDNEQVEFMDEYDLRVLLFDDLIYEDTYNDNEVDGEDDSEDSNQENYYTNDYPDEDDSVLNSISDDDDSNGARYLQQAIEKFVLDDDDDDTDNKDEDNNVNSGQASKFYDSDDDDDGGPYNEPFVHFAHENDVRFGKLYSNCKERSTIKYKDEDEDDSSDDDSCDLYQDFIDKDSNSNTESDVGSYNSANDSN